jgi:hypothetical protein
VLLLKLWCRCGWPGSRAARRRLPLAVDSCIELFSALVVFWRFGRGKDVQPAEGTAAKIAVILPFALAVFVASASAFSLLGKNAAQPTRLGIATLVVGAVFMPGLAKRKRRLAAITRSAALKADATESPACGYLSWIALAGLLLNAIWHISRAGPVAALGLLTVPRAGGVACGSGQTRMLWSNSDSPLIQSVVG